MSCYLSCHNRHAHPWPTGLPLLVLSGEYVLAWRQSEPVLPTLSDGGRCDQDHLCWYDGLCREDGLLDTRPRLFCYRTLKYQNGSPRILRRGPSRRADTGVNPTNDDAVTSGHDGRRRGWHGSRRFGRRLGRLAAHGENRYRYRQGKACDLWRGHFATRPSLSSSCGGTSLLLLH